MDQAITLITLRPRQRTTRGIDDRISPILAMIHHTASGPATHPLEARKSRSRRRDFTKIPEAPPLATPSVNSQQRFFA